MTSTIDAAGRVVIPKALRDRAGLRPGASIDFRFVDGAVELRLAEDDVDWEQYRGVWFPVARNHELANVDVRELIESAREERMEQLSDAGR